MPRRADTTDDGRQKASAVQHSELLDAGEEHSPPLSSPPSSLSPCEIPHISLIMSASSFTADRALGEAKRDLPSKRVIVTGGSGKLGRSVVKYLADEGYEVINVDTRCVPPACCRAVLALTVLGPCGEEQTR